MTFIADACALSTYLVEAGAGMSGAGHAAMRSGPAISLITVWELTRKAAIGKLPPLPAKRGSFHRHLATLGFRREALTWEDADAANRLPPHHKDPMDRMLIATALRADLTIVTNDAIFPSYRVRTIW